MKRVSLSLLFVVFAQFLKAGEVIEGPQMADSFRNDGKIYIVITVIAMIFAAITIFLTMLERKIKKIENQLNEVQGKP